MASLIQAVKITRELIETAHHLLYAFSIESAEEKENKFIITAQAHTALKGTIPVTYRVELDADCALISMNQIHTR